MEFISVRIISPDVPRLVAFYEKALSVPAAWATEDFAELATSRATLAIGGVRTVAMLPADTLRPAENRSVILEFLVEDVDALHRALIESAVVPAEDRVNEPTTMPWGNRSLLVRDPDGNLVNFFTPVTPEAVRKFAR